MVSRASSAVARHGHFPFDVVDLVGPIGGAYSKRWNLVLILAVDATMEGACQCPLPRPKKGLAVRGLEVVSSAESILVIWRISVISESEYP